MTACLAGVQSPAVHKKITVAPGGCRESEVIDCYVASWRLDKRTGKERKRETILCRTIL